MPSAPDFGPRPEWHPSSQVPGESSYGRQRRWRREEARAREKLRPLRLYVNRLLATSGVPHGHNYASGRIAHLNHATEGWQTQSDLSIFQPGVLVEVNENRSTSFSTTDNGYHRAVEVKLRESGLVVDATPTGNFKVYPQSWVSDTTDELRRE
jgi:hypothetical protein